MPRNLSKNMELYLRFGRESKSKLLVCKNSGLVDDLTGDFCERERESGFIQSEFIGVIAVLRSLLAKQAENYCEWLAPGKILVRLVAGRSTTRGPLRLASKPFPIRFSPNKALCGARETGQRTTWVRRGGDTYLEPPSSPSDASVVGVRYPVSRSPRSRKLMFPNLVLKLARARSTAFEMAISSCLRLSERADLHLLSLGASGSVVLGFVKSSKLIMYNDISSISERIGAITSEQRNLSPAK